MNKNKQDSLFDFLLSPSINYNLMKHRRFTIKMSQIGIVLFLLSFLACGNSQKKEKTIETDALQSEPFFKLSLAQWSLHESVGKGDSPFDFAKDAKALGFEGVEYVNQLYTKEIESLGLEAVLEKLKEESEKHGVENVLIMVDNEGDLADPDLEKRNEAVENHKKWVDAAQYLGCHSIRVNTFGTNDPEIWIETVKDGLTKLSEYAATKNINVLVENHGWLSSDAPKVIQVINEINMPNCGTLADFGNWCIKRVEGERWGDCLEEYPDKYEGTQRLMTAAKAVSAKSYDFDDKGNETTIDFKRMLQIVKDSGYSGYISVEFETEGMDEKEGIIATKNLLINSAKQLN